MRAHTEPLASGIAAIADTMATKEAVATVEDKLSAVKDDAPTVKDNVAALTDRVETLSGNMATKDAIANLATKDAIANMATKDHIANMATKDDVANMATKDDVANMATKDSLAALADRVETIFRTMATKEYVDAAARHTPRRDRRRLQEPLPPPLGDGHRLRRRHGGSGQTTPLSPSGPGTARPARRPHPDSTHHRESAVDRNRDPGHEVRRAASRETPRSLRSPRCVPQRPAGVRARTRSCRPSTSWRARTVSAVSIQPGRKQFT